MNLRFLTSGESHGQALTGILEGVPAGFSLSSRDIDGDLARRQGGYGRGGRMKIETDHALILSGVRWGKTLGSPICLLVENKDWENWREGMSPDEEHSGTIQPVTKPRPGHADLAGALKYDHRDIRNVLERSSARETAMRVALGAIAKKFLSEFGIQCGSYVIQIGSIKMKTLVSPVTAEDLLRTFRKAEESPVRCPDHAASLKMVKLIDKARQDGNSLGGIVEVFVTGAPPGIGSYTHWDRKLDGRLAQAFMGIQAIKGVEIGAGFATAVKSGSDVMDAIQYRKVTSGRTKSKRIQMRTGFFRETNNAGGIEGGMSNGMPILIRAAMKPIPTLRKPLRSVDILTKKPFEAAYERSDVCAVPAVGVVGEAMAALVVADAFFEKFGGDSKEEIMRNYDAYMSQIRTF